MTYDPAARRDTPLALKLKERIRREGGMLLADFIAACLWDESHGAYATKDVIGKPGDFITAPEISQVFGEVLGLWAAVVSQQMGSPPRVNLAELGPGRGTLMADALRAMSSVKGLKEALRVTLIEASPLLRTKQQATLAGAHPNLSWAEGFLPLDGGPAIVLANEFLDVFAPDQSIKTADGWRWRAVSLDEAGQFQFAVSTGTRLRPELDAQFPGAPVGSILSHIRSDALAEGLASIANGQPLAALFIDYGHTQSLLGETLQAIRGHAFEHPFTSPGEADISVQVDFADVAHAMRRAGFAVDGPVTQGEFLGRLGIVERASKLMSANPARAGEIETAVARLIGVPGMGDRFKVIGIRRPDMPPLPGF